MPKIGLGLVPRAVPGHYRNITGTLPEHYRNITGTWGLGLGPPHVERLIRQRTFYNYYGWLTRLGEIHPWLYEQTLPVSNEERRWISTNACGHGEG